jgi:hypothetical protein
MTTDGPSPPVPSDTPAASNRKPSTFGNRWLLLGIGLVVGVGAGIGVGAAVWIDPVSEDVADPEVVVEEEEPSPSPEPEQITLSRSDFEIDIKILSEQCFGSAGCNVEFRIDPLFVGSGPLPDEGVIEVTYEVEGLEDSHINTFTIEGDTAEYESEEFGSTTSASVNLRAKVIDVEYTPPF